MLVKAIAFLLDLGRCLQTQVKCGRLQGAEHLLGDQLVHRRRFQPKARLFAIFKMSRILKPDSSHTSKQW